MPLTDATIRTAKPAGKIRKLSDGGGLQLWITPDGAKRWRFAYRHAGKQRCISLGVYPDVGLRDARDARHEASLMVRQGADPSAARKEAKAAARLRAANDFASLADEWLGKKQREGRSDATMTKLRWLVDFARPALGDSAIADIRPRHILPVLQTVEARGRHETAGRLRSTLGEIFRFAVATGRAEVDPTASLKGAIAAPVVTPRAAIIKPEPFGELLRAIRVYSGEPTTRLGLELLALTFVRPGELRFAEWTEFDVARAVWEIPGARMKMRRPHRVPLARQTLTALADLRALTGAGPLLLPGARGPREPISENTCNSALRRMGYERTVMTAHGFRAAASTMLNESGDWNADAIEAQLAHVERNDVRRAYQRADFWDERVRMMQAWADLLDAMRDGNFGCEEELRS